jgi:glycosyltransferase involved in cell wall biosynthesis
MLQPSKQTKPTSMLFAGESLPVSAVVPTCGRANILGRMLRSLRKQSASLTELIIVDGSSEDSTRNVIDSLRAEFDMWGCRVIYIEAHILGAAAQRNQGVEIATLPFIAFFDDDILFEPDCMKRLWQAMQSNSQIGGVNAMIVNQHYHPPGLASRVVYRALAGEAQSSYAGCVLGPAVNLLPEDRDELPEVVPVKWLNSTATLYRREALPDPVFQPHFTGYSLMEDLALSLSVGRQWHLANARTARIYHDSQPGEHKNSLVALGRMQLVNRHYVMTEILGRHRIIDYLRLALWETFQLVVCAIKGRAGAPFWRILHGKLLGVSDLVRGCCSKGQK